MKICIPLLRVRAEEWNFKEQAKPFVAELESQAEQWRETVAATAEMRTAQTYVRRHFKRLTFAEICRWAVLSDRNPQSETLSLSTIRDMYLHLQATF